MVLQMEKVPRMEKGVGKMALRESCSQVHGGLITQPHCEALHTHSHERALGIHKSPPYHSVRRLLYFSLELSICLENKKDFCTDRKPRLMGIRDPGGCFRSGHREEGSNSYSSLHPLPTPIPAEEFCS